MASSHREIYGSCLCWGKPQTSPEHSLGLMPAGCRKKHPSRAELFSSRLRWSFVTAETTARPRRAGATPVRGTDFRGRGTRGEGCALGGQPRGSPPVLPAGGAGPGRAARGYVTAIGAGGARRLLLPRRPPATGRRGCGGRRGAGVLPPARRSGSSGSRGRRRAAREGEGGRRRGAAAGAAGHRRRLRAGSAPAAGSALCASAGLRRVLAVRSPAAGLHNGSRSVGWILPWLLFCRSTHPPSSQVPGYGFLSGDLSSAFCRCLR